MDRIKIRKQSGFSMAELLVVIAIIGVIAVFAVAQFGESANRFQTENIARELKVRLERARFDSVKRRPTDVNDMSRVVINNESSFSVTIDLNQNHTLEPAETQVVDFSGRSNVKILGTGLSYPVTMVFDRRGHVTTTDSAGNVVDPTYTVCDNCTLETASRSNAFIVTLSATGTVSMFHFGQTLPTLTNPTVTNVGISSEIDPMVVVWPNGAAPAGTPVPTPTPSATASPTATSSPTATATPTPTPVTYCQRNDRPAQTGCICQSPMTVDANGQCR